MNTAIAAESYAWPIPMEKLISLAVVALALIFLPPLEIQEAIIVFGQGHFLACYFYQYKYKQIDRAYLIKYFIAMALVFGGYALFPNLYLLVTAASVYFVVHLSVDERYLWKDKPSLQKGLALAPFLLIYSAMIIDSIFVGHIHFDNGVLPPVDNTYPILGIWTTPYGVAAAALAFLVYLAYIRMRPSRMEPHDVYFLLGAGVLAILFATGHVPSHYYLMGAIILFHYSSWYVHYYLRWKDDAPKRNLYIRDMLVVNAIIFALYGFYRWMPHALDVRYFPHQIYPFKDEIHGNALAYLFSPGYFYLWTFMHYISTVRLSDLAYFGIRRFAR